MSAMNNDSLTVYAALQLGSSSTDMKCVCWENSTGNATLVCMAV